METNDDFQTWSLNWTSLYLSFIFKCTVYLLSMLLEFMNLNFEVEEIHFFLSYFQSQLLFPIIVH